MTIRFELAGPEYRRWPDILSLLQHSFAYMANRIDPPSSMTRLDLAGLRAKAHQETCVVAMQGNAIAGCAFLDRRSDCLYIGKVAVADNLRGQGIARQLFAYAEAVAASEGLPFLELQTRIELVENHEAFRKLGFTKSGEDAHDGYDRPTSIRMRKPVDSQGL